MHNQLPENGGDRADSNRPGAVGDDTKTCYDAANLGSPP